MMRCAACQTPVHHDEARSVVASPIGDVRVYHAGGRCDDEARIAYFQRPDSTIQYVSARRRAS